MILEIWDVSDIGLKSFSIDVGGETLGIGLTTDLFNYFGNIPCNIDEW